MTWTYNVYDIATSPKDQVRLLIGDTVDCDPQLQDEEIVFLISSRTTVYGAAAECCRSLASKYARSVDSAAGTQKATLSQLSKQYTSKAIQFEQKASASGAAMPYSGGISIADKQRQDANTDRVPPQFTLDMDDNRIAPAIGGGSEDDTNDESSVQPGD